MPASNGLGRITKRRAMVASSSEPRATAGFATSPSRIALWSFAEASRSRVWNGATLEDVCISNITMRELTDVPFFLRLGSRMRGPEGVPSGSLRRVRISNVVASVSNPRQAAIITGIPGHAIEDIGFNNISLVVPGGGTKEDAAVAPPEIESVYPDPNRFGPMPAFGFFVRHVKGINVCDVEIRCLREDFRPAFVLSDVEAADFTHVKVPKLGSDLGPS